MKKKGVKNTSRENRKILTHAARKSIWFKYGCCCAYCGKEIEFNEMHVDHLVPLANGGVDNATNYMPSCDTCNLTKGTLSLEDYRNKIKHSVDDMLSSPTYKQCLNYGLIEPMHSNTIQDVVFYFEECGETFIEDMIRNGNSPVHNSIKHGVDTE